MSKCSLGCILEDDGGIAEGKRNITLHGFPFRSKELLNKWVNAIGIPDWYPKTNSRICSRHFEDKYITKSGWSSVYRLDRNAVPSIFFHSIENETPADESDSEASVPFFGDESNPFETEKEAAKIDDSAKIQNSSKVLQQSNQITQPKKRKGLRKEWDFEAICQDLEQNRKPAIDLQDDETQQMEISHTIVMDEDDFTLLNDTFGKQNAECQRDENTSKQCEPINIDVDKDDTAVNNCIERPETTLDPTTVDKTNKTLNSVDGFFEVEFDFANKDPTAVMNEMNSDPPFTMNQMNRDPDLVMNQVNRDSNLAMNQSPSQENEKLTELLHCRFCLSKDKEALIIIFETQLRFSNVPIFEVIEKCSGIKVSNDDGISDRMCKTCLSKFEYIFAFREQCKNSEEFLKTLKPAGKKKQRNLLPVNTDNNPKSSKRICLQDEPHFSADSPSLSNINTSRKNSKLSNFNPNNTSGMDPELFSMDDFITFKNNSLSLYFDGNIKRRDPKISVRKDLINNSVQKDSDVLIMDDVMNFKNSGISHADDYDYGIDDYSKSRPYNCAFCEEKFQTECILRSHIRTWHKVDGEFMETFIKCEVCGKTLRKNMLCCHNYIHRRREMMEARRRRKMKWRMRVRERMREEEEKRGIGDKNEGREEWEIGTFDDYFGREIELEEEDSVIDSRSVLEHSYFSSGTKRGRKRGVDNGGGGGGGGGEDEGGVKKMVVTRGCGRPSKSKRGRGRRRGGIRRMQ